MPVIFVHRRRVDDVGRRIGFIEVDDKLAEKLVKRGDAKLAPSRRKPRKPPAEAKAESKGKAKTKGADKEAPKDETGKAPAQTAEDGSKAAGKES